MSSTRRRTVTIRYTSAGSFYFTCWERTDGYEHSVPGAGPCGAATSDEGRYRGDRGRRFALREWPARFPGRGGYDHIRRGGIWAPVLRARFRSDALGFDQRDHAPGHSPVGRTRSNDVDLLHRAVLDDPGVAEGREV